MQDLFELSNLNLYNTIEKTAVAQSTPRGNFTQHTKRYQKIASYIRRNPPYSLWRNIFNSLVLPKTQTEGSEKVLRDLRLHRFLRMITPIYRRHFNLCNLDFYL